MALLTSSGDKSPAINTSWYAERWFYLEMRRVQERGGSVARTRVKVSMIMIRPNRKGSIGPRIDKTVKSKINRDHGRLLR